MIKSIVFDIGEVLLKEHNGRIYDIIEKRFGMDESKVRKVAPGYLNKSLTRNRQDFWFERKIAKKFGLDERDFIDTWMDLKKKNFELDKGVKKLILDLKRKGYLLVSLTDVNHSHDLMREGLGLYSLFDMNLKSFELKVIKPSKKFYRILLKKTGLPPHEIVFIDGIPLNLENPKKMGIKTILFKNASQLKKDMIKCGVKIK